MQRERCQSAPLPFCVFCGLKPTTMLWRHSGGRGHAEDAEEKREDAESELVLHVRSVLPPASDVMIGT